jgi:RNA polymerase sigma-70 factor, ECF subfamily
MNADELDRLVQRVQKGEQEPFWDLLLHVQQDLRLFIAVLAPSTELVEEILQATFLRCYDILPKYEPRGLFLQWIKGIARNLLREELRARSRHLAMTGDRLETMVADACLQDAAEAAEPEPGLQDCLERLAPHSRQLLERRYRENLPLNRIAQQFKKPAESVAVSLYRIRESLRQCLEAKGMQA